MSARVAPEERGRRPSFVELKSFNKVHTIPVPCGRRDGERMMGDISGKRGTTSSSSSSNTFSGTLDHMTACPDDAAVQCSGFAAILALLCDHSSSFQSSDLNVPKLCAVVTDTMARFAVDAAVQ